MGVVLGSVGLYDLSATAAHPLRSYGFVIGHFIGPRHLCRGITSPAMPWCNRPCGLKRMYVITAAAGECGDYLAGREQDATGTVRRSGGFQRPPYRLRHSAAFPTCLQMSAFRFDITVPFCTALLVGVINFYLTCWCCGAVYGYGWARVGRCVNQVSCSSTRCNVCTGHPLDLLSTL